MPSVTVNDISVAYEEAGAGRPVLLVHGFPLDHSMWAPVAEALAGECRLIMPDLRGYGGSSLGEIDPAAGVPMTRYADDLAGLLDAIGVTERVVYAGFSMGGYIGWQFVRRHRPRLAALAVVDSRAGEDTAAARENRLKMAGHVAEWGARHVAGAMLPKLFAPASLETPHPAVKATGDVIAAANPAAIAAAQRGMAARPDETSLLPTLDLPVAAIVGEHDTLTPPSEAEAIAAAAPDATATLVPGAGHMAPVENPAAVSDALKALLARL